MHMSTSIAAPSESGHSKNVSHFDSGRWIVVGQLAMAVFSVENLLSSNWNSCCSKLAERSWWTKVC